MTSTRLRQLIFIVSAMVLNATLLGCLTTVDGERATTGMCPEGETCSTGDVQGIRFIGQAFFDAEQATQLGPVAVGGTFQLGLIGVGGTLNEYNVTLEDESPFSADMGQEQFLPVDEEGNSIVQTDGYVLLHGRSPNSSYVRITDPVDGTLIDRLRLDVLEVDEVVVELARDAERDFLIAGCRELIAVRLVSRDELGGERRVFDQSVVISAEGSVLDEQMWDCISFEASEDASEATFQINFANETHEHTMPVRPWRKRA